MVPNKDTLLIKDNKNNSISTVDSTNTTDKLNNIDNKVVTKTNDNVTFTNPKKTNNDLTVVKNPELELSQVNYNDYENNKNSSKKIISNISILIIFLIATLLLAFSVFTVYNTTSEKIANGVFIKGVDVSGLTKESALNTINTFIKEHSSDEVILKHNDYKSSISLSQINASFDVQSAVNTAYSINKNDNFFKNSFSALKLLFIPTNIEPNFTYDKKQLEETLNGISPNLPDTIIESSYYIEGNTLIVTKGRTGNIVNVNEMKLFIENQIYNLNFKGKELNIITITKSPTPINLDEIYKELHKDPKDAHFTQNPYALFPSENGMDFGIPLAEAKAQLEQEQTESHIPLKVLYPNVTTNMIGNEAFPNVLSSFSTRYVANPNRTTNLILASNKIDGMVLMPGETFSYNKIVGERTISEGYREAAIFVNGKTVDGLGGGICQVSTTLYEAALYANLEIIERRNHQLVPSYIGPGLDATVVYGLTDFKFKNNRNYPIKIISSVSNGLCTFQILGLATPDDYEVVINANSSRTATSVNAITYKTLKKNSQIVSSEVISRDTYKRN